ncbi:hypothetical protein BH18ACI4_BH18ACI4_13280 [soil metagenome]
MLLAGNLSDYPLALLLEILLHKRETGLLQVASPKQSGYFFIKEGEIKGGEVGKLRGAQAVDSARSFADATFQFERIEPSDYARVVWEKSFGQNKPVAVSPDVRLETFRTRFEQFPSYAETAYGILQRSVASLAGRLLRQLMFYAPAAYRSLKKAGVLIARLTLAYATAAYELLKRAQVRTKLLSAWRKALALWQIALRRIKELILTHKRVFSFQAALALIRKKAVLPSRQAVIESNISFVVVVVAILVGTAVTISKILAINQDHVDAVETTDENTSIQSQTNPRPARERGKRKPRSGRQTPAEKNRGASMRQESVPQAPAERAPSKATNDSDVPKKLITGGKE